MFKIIIILLFSRPLYAQNIIYTDKLVKCSYDLTFVDKNDIAYYTTIDLVGKLTYVVTDRYGRKQLGVDFTDSLNKLNLNTIYNHSFISNMDDYKCKEIK
jgi:hypothetical protein